MSENLLRSERLSFQEASADPQFSLIIEWIERFLCAPHPDLGRTGDVCPFTRVAVAKDAIEFFRNTSENVADLEKDIKLHLLDFNAGDKSNIYRSRIIMPACLEDADRAVELVQRELKPLFVEHHLMLGQFFKDCNESGLWNKDFRPLQTPVPMLAIRSMVPTDVAFLHYDPDFLTSYLDKFGTRGITALRQLEKAIEAVK